MASYEPVDVYVLNQSNQPVEGVTVRVFNPTGSVFFTQQVTNSEGKASFLLFTQQYSMRFYKFQANFQQPQMFTVLEAPQTNAFTVQGEVFIPPVATDARLCRCSGYFRNIDGSAQEYLDMHFYPEFSPVIIDGIATVPRKVAIRTDEKGYAQLDLIRCGCYRVTIEGMEHEERYIRVPDLAGANLPDILYAIVKNITFDINAPTLTVGDQLEITPMVLDSTGVVMHGTASQDVDWSSSDTSVMSITVKESTILLRANAPGSAQLKAERRDLSVIRIPDRPIEGQPLTITVT